MSHFQIVPLQQICTMLRLSSMAGSGGTSLVSLAVPGAESLMLSGEGWKGLVGARCSVPWALACAPRVDQSSGMEPHPSCVQPTPVSLRFNRGSVLSAGLLVTNGKG